jgi:hypothetical protein
MAALVLLFLLLLLGAASLTGHAADSRHPDFTLGPVAGRARRLRTARR